MAVGLVPLWLIHRNLHLCLLFVLFLVVYSDDGPLAGNVLPQRQCVFLSMLGTLLRSWDLPGLPGLYALSTETSSVIDDVRLPQSTVVVNICIDR